MKFFQLRLFLLLFGFYFSLFSYAAQSFIEFEKLHKGILLAENSNPIPLIFDNSEEKGLHRAVNDLRLDFERVVGNQPEIISKPVAPKLIIIGTIEKSQWISQLVDNNKIDLTGFSGKHEKFIITNISNPFPHVDEAVLIAGSDMRGAIYGVYELSQQIGVSPWYWWADVPVVKQENIIFKPGVYTDGEPAVEYRGIFLNDEAPALTGWSQHTFGGFNHKFYEKVFELILRLKGNFLWPAMWGSAFYDDDALNGPLADEMGIVIGTSHHEPMGRAHDEWRRYGEGDWNYQTNPDALHQFWKGGMERMKDFEKIVTVGMRGDGDEPMSEESNIALLEEIIEKQREIIDNVTADNADKTPQVWALYKEVQDYYDKGMRVPDDVILLLCDDNWGNVRKLPHPGDPERAGGYGMYYHFDYVGGPRNYKWINVTQVQRLWEQMNLTYSQGVDKIWVVNVGDLKPMEYPISFFLDMAWNPGRFNETNLLEHTEIWCKQQFGEKYAQKAAEMIDRYTRFNRRITPELLNDTIYSLENYNEFERVVNDYRDLVLDAMRLYYLIPKAYKDAFDQLVLFPINAMSNLYEMYFAVAKNKYFYKKGDKQANYWADQVKVHFDNDSVLTHHYNHVIADGKWTHMMDQVRIGYTYWQQPEKSVMPQVNYIENPKPDAKVFIENDEYVSIEAENFIRSKGTDNVSWKVIPGLGKTKSGVTTFPANLYPSSEDEIYLEYEFETESSGEVDIYILLSPTLNFNQNKGLRYAVSLNGGEEAIVNINDEYDIKQMEHWQANSINKTVTKHFIEKSGRQRLRFRILEPGIVLQKLMIDFGGLKESYLGAPESEQK